MTLARERGSGEFRPHRQTDRLALAAPAPPGVAGVTLGHCSPRVPPGPASLQAPPILTPMLPRFECTEVAPPLEDVLHACKNPRTARTT